jgi:hypothetical protein
MIEKKPEIVTREMVETVTNTLNESVIALSLVAIRSVVLTASYVSFFGEKLIQSISNTPKAKRDIDYRNTSTQETSTRH